MTDPLEKNVIEIIDGRENLILEIGCGNRKRHHDAICIDIMETDCVDIVGDIYSVLPCFPENSVSAVYSYHCFEHLDDIASVMRMLTRAMKPEGILSVVTPHFSNPYFYSDPTHKTAFGLYTFSYFSNDRIFARKVPCYEDIRAFELEAVKLIFKSPRPFYFRFAVKKIFQFLFNLNRYMMEFYEENLSSFIPCYEIHYTLKKTVKNPS